MYMIDLPLDAAKLMRFAWGQGHGRTADEDFGYAAHAWLAATLGESAPKPFRLQENRHGLRLLGYTSSPLAALAEQAHTYADPSALAVCDWSTAADKAMPAEWSTGRRLGFEVRVCPISRAERERDIFLVAISRAEAAGSAPPPSRPQVYADWLARQLTTDDATTVETNALRLIGFRRVRGQRNAHVESDIKQRGVERPDALFTGEFTVRDADAFARLLARGIGRHRAFGFGMVLLRPPTMRV
ncbi:MAG: type I-E CRISPR-associated protein Cas6/Cse3/CasE [Hydrogenophilales bacterium]|nr:type I-E CRISPR-associated protein Cas6/Cse3/CasE [Hydrogenophilales bacterium]